MKKTIKKIVKAAVGVVAAGAIVVTGFMANEIFGNPISKHIAEKNAVEFVEENYPELKFEVTDTIYNFKSARYHTTIQLTEGEKTKFTVSCHQDGEYSHDDYKWVALGRFENAVTEEIRPLLVKEFGEKSEPEIRFVDFLKLTETETVSINQNVDLDNFPFELEIDVNVYTDEEDHNEVIADAIRKIDSVVDDRFVVGNYIIDIYNADGTDLLNYVTIPAEAAQFAY